MTHVPLNFPLSWCIPKECNNTELFNPTLGELTKFLNKNLNIIKESTNLDALHDNIPDYLYSNSGPSGHYFM